MEFIVMTSGSIIHEGPVLPGAYPTRIGMPAIEGEGDEERLGVNYVEGWAVRVNDLAELLALVDAAPGQMVIGRALGYVLWDAPKGSVTYALDLVQK